jgi:hypothetical protein
MEEGKKNDPPAGGLKGLRTFRTDVQEMEKKGISVVELAKEAGKKKNLKDIEEPASSFARKIFLVLLVVLLVGGGFAYFYFFYGKSQLSQPASPVSLPKPILVGDNVVKDVTPAGTPGDFLKTISPNPPPELIESLGNRFMVAEFSLTKEWTVSIFSITNYESAFGGMIKWENDLGGNFQDKIIQNHDCRESPNLVYSFIDQNYLVITQGEEPLIEVFHRFSSPQYLNE